MFVTVIGRGHSGTRAISHTLTASGVFMGAPLNESGDLIPPGGMYRAARILSRHVRWLGGLDWDWSALESMPIPPAFEQAVGRYLASPLASDAPHRGWKLPETTLCYPWIRRMFPDIRYVFWVRNPRDCILNRHNSDDLGEWGIPCPSAEDVRLCRAYSWLYQYRIVRAMPRPAHWLEVRFEDFVLDQARTLERLEDFLGIPLARIPVRPESVGRYRGDNGRNHYAFFEPAMREYGYEIPGPSDPARAPLPDFESTPTAARMLPRPQTTGTGMASKLLAFEDVPILPYSDLPHGRTRARILHRGGPFWPDWTRQLEARHCREGEPIDIPPQPVVPREVIDDPVAWGGAIVPHFGHQISEFSCRILPTLAEDPEATFAFGVNLQDGIESLETAPRFFSEILAWFGVPPPRVRVVTRPTLARHLVVAPQAEQLGGLGPNRVVDPSYLEALDALTERRLGRPMRRGTIYVSRAGQRKRFGGEREIEGALARAGVDIFRPEDFPLVEQLRRYASAERLVFAEGSALHGLQLLGRNLGDVHIIVRRPGSVVGGVFVRPRAKSVEHVDHGLRLVHGLNPRGEIASTLPVLDEERLLEGMEALGIPVRRHWQSRRYHEAVERDATEWLLGCCDRRQLSIPGSADAFRESLSACGLGHLRPIVDRAIAQLARPGSESNPTPSGWWQRGV